MTASPAPTTAAPNEIRGQPGGGGLHGWGGTEHEDEFLSYVSSAETPNPTQYNPTAMMTTPTESRAREGRMALYPTLAATESPVSDWATPHRNINSVMPNRA